MNPGNKRMISVWSLPTELSTPGHSGGHFLFPQIIVVLFSIFLETGGTFICPFLVLLSPFFFFWQVKLHNL